MNPARKMGAGFCSAMLLVCMITLTLQAARAHPLDNWVTVYTVQSPYGSAALLSVRASPGLCVAVGAQGQIASSADGLAWAPQISGTTKTLLGVGYGAGVWVVVGDSGTILSSSDGTNWTARTSGVTARLHSIEYGNGVFVVLPESDSSNPAVLTSEDGIQWVVKNPGAVVSPYFLTFGEGLFLAAQTVGTNMVSADGTNWHKQASGTVHGLYTVSYRGDQFMAIDTTSRVWTSDDATNWTARGKVSVIRPPEIGFGNGYYLAVGSGPPVYSTAGDTWLAAGTNTSAGAVTFANGSFLVTSGNRILRSDPILRLRLEAPGKLWLEGPVGRQVRVETSGTIPFPDWQEAATFILESSPYNWLDSLPVADSMRFYRAVLPQ